MQPPFHFYEAPKITYLPPPVVRWYRLYAAATALLFMAVAAVFPTLLAIDPSASQRHDGDALAAWLLGVMGALGAIFYGVAAAAPVKPWGWTLGLVAICLGLTGCTAVLAVPLLVFWMKPEVKSAFGRA